MSDNDSAFDVLQDFIDNADYASNLTLSLAQVRELLTGINELVGLLSKVSKQATDMRLELEGRFDTQATVVKLTAEILRLQEDVDAATTTNSGLVRFARNLQAELDSANDIIDELEVELDATEDARTMRNPQDKCVHCVCYHDDPRDCCYCGAHQPVPGAATDDEQPRGPVIEP